MICLVPISRFRVGFEVAAGRPFSLLERTVLRAIKQGVTVLDEMQRTFQVHPRILIDALVTLTQAGWVSFSSQEGGGFRLTSEGATATDENENPSTITVASKTAFFLLERLTGDIIGNDEVRFISQTQLGTTWVDAVRLKADFHENRVDEGQVRRLLPRRQGEWVRWIGPIDMVSKGAHWVPVDVDTAAGTLAGLPDRWRTRLGPVILGEAKRRETTVSPRVRTRRWIDGGEAGLRASGARDGFDRDVSPGGSWPADVAEGDLLCDGDEHDSLLVKALEEATSSIFVASAFLGNTAVEALREPLLGALRRGVNLDLLWGYAAGAEPGAPVLERLKKLAYESRRAGYAGALRFNRAASGSHAKMLIFDAPTGMSAVIGSYNWLSAFKGQDRTANLSVRLRHDGAIAEACGCAAGLWASAESEALSSTADRWRSVAADLERQVASAGRRVLRNGTEGDSATVRFVFDREHEVIMREWSASSQYRLLVFSHRLGPAAEIRLVQSERSIASLFITAYGFTNLDKESLSRVDRMVSGAGGTVRRVAGMHAKVLVSDASVCISSYNFLSADPFGNSSGTRELGVVIEGGDVATRVAERLATVSGIPLPRDSSTDAR